jgi:hypothetical protein
MYKIGIYIVSTILGCVVIAYFSSLLIRIESVPEGHVGVYFRGGKLLQHFSEAGYQIRPFFTRYHPVQVTVQSDVIEKINCTSKDLLNVQIQNIQVENILHRQAVLRMVQDYGLNYDLPLILRAVDNQLHIICTSSTLEDLVGREYSNLTLTIKNHLQDLLTTRNISGLSIVNVKIGSIIIPDGIAAQFEGTAIKRLEKARDHIVHQTLLANLHATHQRNHDQKVHEANMTEIDRKIQIARALIQNQVDNITLTENRLKYEYILALSNNTKFIQFDNPNIFVSSQ